MGKMPVVIIAISLLAVAAIVGYLTLGRSSLKSNNSLTNETSMLAEGEGGQRSLQEILGLGTNLECNFTDLDTGSNGTVYVGTENKMRGDFVSISNGTNVNGHMIADGENLYLWMDGEDQGFKASMSASEELAEEMTGTTGSFDINQKVDYECHDWAPDNSKFTLPSGVEFEDFSAMMEGMGEMMEHNEEHSTEGTSEQCAVCDSLPADSQAQCKQALGC